DQIREIRNRLERDCQVRLSASVTSDFLAPMREAIANGVEANTEALEETARALRMLEAAGRSMSNQTAVYQAIMAPAVEAVEETPATAGLWLADRVRLLEILAGPDRALALLARE